MKTFRVYFLQESHDGPIKIGMTAGSVSLRIAAIQAGNYRRFQLLGVIETQDATLEAQWHDRFADVRTFGEWFCPTNELLAAIYSESRAGTNCDTVHASLMKRGAR